MISLPCARTAAVSMLIVLVCACFAAQATEPENPGEKADEHHGVELHSNELTLFLGVTDEGGHATQGTVGLEYLHLMGERWSMGGFIDAVGGDFRNLIVGVPFAWVPVGRLKLVAAPAIEWHEDRGESHEGGHGETDEDSATFALRLGVSYDFPIDKHWRVSPVVNVDFVDGHNL